MGVALLPNGEPTKNLSASIPAILISSFLYSVHLSWCLQPHPTEQSCHLPQEPQFLLSSIISAPYCLQQLKPTVLLSTLWTLCQCTMK